MRKIFFTKSEKFMKTIDGLLSYCMKHTRRVYQLDDGELQGISLKLNVTVNPIVPTNSSDTCGNKYQFASVSIVENIEFTSNS